MEADSAPSPAEGLLYRWLCRQGFCGIRQSQALRTVYFFLAKTQESKIRVVDKFS